MKFMLVGETLRSLEGMFSICITIKGFLLPAVFCFVFNLSSKIKGSVASFCADVAARDAAELQHEPTRATCHLCGDKKSCFGPNVAQKINLRVSFYNINSL